MNKQALIIICVAASGCISISSTQSVDAEVTEVVDGDTATVKFNNQTEEVRFNGIDTPEVNAEVKPYAFEGVPNSRSGRNCLGRYGENASEYVKRKISDSEITLEYKASVFGENRGNYGRLLGTIYYDNKNKSLNRELVEKGLARSYSNDGPFFEQEVEAKLNMTGVWNCQAVG